MTSSNQASFTTLEFPSEDGSGTRIKAWRSRPSGSGPFPGVLISTEAWGLSEHMRRVSDRFTEHGYLVVTPDLYARGDGSLPANMPELLARWHATPDDQALADLRGGLNVLRADSDCNGTIGVVGFCSGGRYALMLSCTDEPITAAVDCYGGRVVRANLLPTQPVLPLTQLDRLSCPLLGIFGDKDQDPSMADVDVFDGELQRLGKQHDFKTYEGAGHAFLNETSPVLYSPERAEEAWPYILGWCEEHLMARTPVRP